jgi:hypothetical protein
MGRADPISAAAMMPPLTCVNGPWILKLVRDLVSAFTMGSWSIYAVKAHAVGRKHGRKNRLGRSLGLGVV